MEEEELYHIIAIIYKIYIKIKIIKFKSTKKVLIYSWNQLLMFYHPSKEGFLKGFKIDLKCLKRNKQIIIMILKIRIKIYFKNKN